MKASSLPLLVVLLLVAGSIAHAMQSGYTVRTSPPAAEPEVAKGDILYFPTEHNAERNLESMLPNGAIPEEKVIDTTILAGRGLELAVMYHYIGEARYRAGYERVKNFLRAVEQRYSFYPEFLTIDGYALSFENNTFVSDAIKAGDLLVYTPELPELTFEEEMRLYCSAAVLGEEGGMVDTNDFVTLSGAQGNCPYLSEYELRYGNRSFTLVCNASEVNTVLVRYSIAPEALFEAELKPEHVRVEKVFLTVNGSEREVGYDEGVLRGIQLKVIEKGVDYFRQAFVGRAFSDPEFKRGLRGSTPGTLKEMIGFQFRRVLFYDGEGREYMLPYAERISLLKGRVELPPLYVNTTLSYEIPLRGKIVESIKGNLTWDNRTGVLRPAGIDFSKPQKLSIEVRYFFEKPTVEFRAHSLIDYFARGVVSTTASPFRQRFYLLYEDDWESVSLNATALLCEALTEKPSLLHAAVSNYLANYPRSETAKALYRALLILSPEALPEEVHLSECTVYKPRLEHAFQAYEESYRDALYAQAKERLYSSFLSGSTSLSEEELALREEARLLNETRTLELFAAWERTKHNSTEYERYRDFLSHYYPEIVEAIDAENYTYARELTSAIEDEKARQIFLGEISLRREELRKEREVLYSRAKSQAERGRGFSEELAEDIEAYLKALERFGEQDRDMEKLYALRDEPEFLKELLGLKEAEEEVKPSPPVLETPPPARTPAPATPEPAGESVRRTALIAVAVLLLLAAAVLYLRHRAGVRRGG
jgi:hypothetical protein